MKRTWATHCRDEFDYMMVHRQRRLLKLIASGELRDTLLCYAAMAAGGCGAAAIPVLLPLLQRPEAYVREGAVTGLHHCANGDPEVLEQLFALSNDPSPAVRRLIEYIKQHPGG